MSLRNRFTVLFVAFAVLATALEGVLSWSTARRYLEEALDQRLLDIAGVAADLQLKGDDLPFLLILEPEEESNTLWLDYQETLQRLASSYVDRADIFRWEPGERAALAVVTTAPADSIGIGQELSWVQPYLSTAVAEALQEGHATTELFEGLDGRFYKYGILDLGAGAFLGVLIPADHLEPLDNLRLTVVGVSAGAAVLAAIIGWSLAGGIVARLRSLSRAALRIQRGWMDRPVTLEGEDELGRLARAMERMRSGIQRRDEQMRLMLSQVAHEIRNPLGGLELFSAAAMDTEDPRERRRILERVRTEVAGLNGIIDEFLGFARPGESEPALHDVRDPIGEAATLAEAELEKKGGSLHLQLPPEPALVSADPLQVKRLVLNLMRNAAQAGTSVWVAVEMVRGEVRIAIRDNGPGIPAKLRDHIFEPFVGDKEQGAGLGLAIVRKLVEANHGRVELVRREATEDGSVGNGAEFHVYFGGLEDLPVEGVERRAARGGRN